MHILSHASRFARRALADGRMVYWRIFGYMRGYWIKARLVKSYHKARLQLRATQQHDYQNMLGTCLSEGFSDYRLILDAEFREDRFYPVCLRFRPEELYCLVLHLQSARRHGAKDFAVFIAPCLDKLKRHLNL